MIYRLKKPIKAIWKSKDFDLQVTLIKLYLHEDKEIFFAIKESSTCIPYKQLEFKENTEVILLDD